MNIGDYVVIHRMDHINIRHPLCARVIELGNGKLRAELVSGSYNTGGDWVELGYKFYLNYPRTSGWVAYTEDDLPDEVWAEIAARALLGETT